MIDYEVRPGTSIGPAVIGMSRDEVRAAVAAEPDTFERGQTDVDGFHDNAFQVNYDRDGIVEFVEATTDDSYRVLWQGVELLSMPAKDVLSALETLGPFVRDDPDTVQFTGARIGFWSEDPESTGPFTSVSVWRRGYWEEES